MGLGAEGVREPFRLAPSASLCILEVRKLQLLCMAGGTTGAPETNEGPRPSAPPPPSVSKRPDGVGCWGQSEGKSGVLTLGTPLQHPLIVSAQRLDACID
jgi:hypothetical protein